MGIGAASPRSENSTRRHYIWGCRPPQDTSGSASSGASLMAMTGFDHPLRPPRVRGRVARGRAAHEPATMRPRRRNRPAGRAASGHGARAATRAPASPRVRVQAAPTRSVGRGRACARAPRARARRPRRSDARLTMARNRRRSARYWAAAKVRPSRPSSSMPIDQSLQLERPRQLDTPACQARSCVATNCRPRRLAARRSAPTPAGHAGRRRRHGDRHPAR
jgi:hypothetical protein